MRTLTRFLCVASLGAFLASNGTALAQTADTNTPAASTAKPKKAKSKSATVTGVVASVDNDAKTLTLKDHDKAYQITSKTRITKDGQPALLSDLAVGETVRVSGKEDAAGVLDATTIRTGAAPTPKKKKKKAPKPETPPAETTPANPAPAPAPAVSNTPPPITPPVDLHVTNPPPQ